MSEPERRLKRLILSEGMLLRFFQTFREPCRIQIEGLPEDALFWAVTADQQRNAVQVLVHSETFEAVPEGEVIPEMGFTVSRIWAEE